MKKKNQFTLPRKGSMKVPVRVFTNSKLAPDKIATSVLIKMATVEGLIKPVIALPDIHYKFNTSFRFSTPTGTVAAFKNKLVPSFVNTDCGMSFFKTNLNLRDLDENKIDSLFKTLKKKISVGMRISPVIGDEDLKDIIVRGERWAFDKYGFDRKDLLNILNPSFEFKEKINYNEILPKQSFEVGKLSLGVLGTGNHFLELQKVDEVLDKKAASVLGLKKGQIVFMLHCGSMFFGDILHDYYSNKRKIPLVRKIYWSLILSKNLKFLYALFYKMNLYRRKVTSYISSKRKRSNKKIKTLNINTFYAKSYLIAKQIAMNYGIANRLTLIKIVKDSLSKEFNKVNLSILIDLSHDTLYKEKIENEFYYIYRHGANRAYPKELLKDHPLFEKTGQLVPLPSSMGNYSYLCGACKGVKETLYSINHGTGRVLDKVDARSKHNLNDLNEEMNKFKVKLYRYGVGNIAEEIPSSFKDVEAVLNVMESNKIAKPIVRLKPLAVLKGD
tara:strand:+ start:2715 stop:4214 length:1500 start_codon:yes stop_codon:yes gene_type:complete